jgi:hypothetical protein
MSDDSGHFYKRDGSPCYKVKTADGKGERGINLRWDRPLGLVPSVTTVTSIMNKHQLNIWRENQLVLAALTAARREGEGDEEFCRRIREEGFAEVGVAIDMGTLVHDALECHFQGKDYDDGLVVYVAGVIEELNTMYPDIRDWVAERSFAHPSGFGGRVDLYSPSTGVVVDFKGRDGDFTDKKTIKFDQYVQLSGYQIGLGLPLGEAANIFFSRTHPGTCTHVIWDKKAMKKGHKIFTSALELWKAVKDYNSAFKFKESPFGNSQVV